ncbi:sugar phosphate isomerase/epimerase family protein [Nocardia farcinica]|uniref:sugar phosphate isomerase/epimerase family protein n=1 Tax=Nocardia farcinica TaxID=37329 RepID=UPI0024543FA7|nr:sugar phosphate isomerase/epimerase [Nocardia farcinica]
MFPDRLGCSTISFRHLPLDAALRAIADLGCAEIDLGALPGVCDHVPFELDAVAVERVAKQVAASGLRVRSVNGDIGDLNRPPDAGRGAHRDMLLALTASVGAQALVLPCGALSPAPVRSLEADLDLVAAQLDAAAQAARAAGVALWTESLHVHRLCHDLERATELTARLGPDIGVVMDFSHIVASGADPVEFVHRFASRIAHVHLRDAEPGDINLSIGRGVVDFAAVADHDYRGHFSLELETRDVTDAERPEAAVRAARTLAPLIR